MSFDPDRSASKDFGEHYLHTINKRDYYPPDFEIGYQYFKNQHGCMFCGNVDDESNLILCKDGNWRHEVCNEMLIEINNKFKKL
jgi:hypothetical protein